jgi:hypothetical protein
MSQIITHPTVKVLTGPEWLVPQYDGFMKENNMIEVHRDPYNRPYLPLAVLNDPTYDWNAVVNGKPLHEWVYEIDWCYYQIEEETE